MPHDPESSSSGASALSAGRLVFVITEDWWLRLHWLDLVLALRDLGFEVTLVTRIDQHGDYLRSLGLAEVIDFDFGRGRISPWVNLRTLARLCGIYRRIKPNLVCHVALQPTVLGAMAARLTGGTNVLSIVPGTGYITAPIDASARLPRQGLKFLLGWALRRSSHTIVQNSDDETFVRSLGVEPEHVTTMRGVGVDLEQFCPRGEPEGAVRVTMVSRMLWSKGTRELVGAAERIRQSHPDVCITLVGEPDPDNASSVPPEQLRSWAADGHVEWWGHCADIADVWARSHVAVLPTYGEGLPTALVEAAACGRPIIATDVPGCRDIVHHGENGLLIPPRDIDALVDAITMLADDPFLRAAMGAAARRDAEAHFSRQKIIRGMLEICRRVATG